MGKWHPRGAKAPLSPTSQPASPKGHRASPRDESPPAEQAMVVGDSPVPFPRGGGPLVGEPRQSGPCRTHRHGPTRKAAQSPWDKGSVPHGGLQLP